MEKWITDTFYRLVIERLPPDVAQACLREIPALYSVLGCPEVAQSPPEFSIGYSVFIEKGLHAAGSRGIEMTETEVEQNLDEFLNDFGNSISPGLCAQITPHLPSELRWRLQQTQGSSRAA